VRCSVPAAAACSTSVFTSLRASVSDENDGLDVTQHGEEAYIQSEGLTSTIGLEATGTTPGMVQTPITAR